MKAIKNAIVDALDEIAGVGNKIRKVYGYFEPSPQEFPCVLVFLKGFDEERLDFQSNQLNADFTLKLCLAQPKSANASNLEDLRLDCIDTIRTKFRTKEVIETLGGETFAAQFTAGEPYMSDETSIPMLITDLTLSVKKQEYIDA